MGEVESLSARIAGGDEGALEECYRDLGPLVRSYLRGFVGDAELDDLVQVTFLEVWQGRGRLDPSRRLEPWVLTIARRRAIDHLRRRRQVLPVSAMRNLVGEDGDRTVERMAWAWEVRLALERLPSTQRQALELAYFSQLTQPEIASRLGVPLGTVKARTWRGLRALAERLEGETP